MNAALEQDTLELQTEVDFVETEKSIELSKLIDLAMFRIKLNDKVEDLVAMDSRCNHTGDCGSSNHQGNGYCHWCKICNPSNPRAY
jgi:hypothetical protein